MEDESGWDRQRISLAVRSYCGMHCTQPLLVRRRTFTIQSRVLRAAEWKQFKITLYYVQALLEPTGLLPISTAAESRWLNRSLNSFH